jgi:1-acyl-sn-glycerol-3-phosphate acyltransferase
MRTEQKKTLERQSAALAGRVMDFWYAFARSIVKVYLGFFSGGFRVTGEGNLPPGPRIIAANHPNATDGFYFPFVFEEKLSFLIQGDILSIPLIGFLLAKSGQIAVHLGKGNLALEQACAKLAQGRSVVIFPEARLNPDDEKVKAHIGAVKLSLQSGVPIVPVGLHVSAADTLHLKLRRPGRQSQGRWQFRGRCYIKIGMPWRPEEECSENSSRPSLRELTARLMEKINALALQAAREVA